MKVIYQSYRFPPPPTPKPKNRGWIKRRNANVIEICFRIGRKLHTFAVING